MPDSCVRILYLAKYAPEVGDYVPVKNEKDGITPIYHYEIFSILKQLGYYVTGTRSLDFLISNHAEFDFVFSLYNRMPFNNSEVFPSALCEYLKIPYLGASPIIRSIAEDKNLAKLVARNAGVDTPLWTIFRTSQSIMEPEFDPPYFIKPRFGASSEYIDENSIANNWLDAVERIKLLQERGVDVIVEEYIDGINLTLPIVFTDPIIVMPAISAVSNMKGNVLSYAQKRMLDIGIKREIYPNSRIGVLAQNAAIRIYQFLQSPVDYARFDFRYNPKTNRLSFLEFNICCNLGSHSSICQSAKHIGLSQKELVKKITEFSLLRQKTGR